MIIGPKIYFDDNLNERQQFRSLQRLRLGVPAGNRTMLVRVKDDKNLLQIVSHRELQRLKDRGKNLALAGIAKDREGAFALVETIVTDIIDEFTDINVETLEKGLAIDWQL